MSHAIAHLTKTALLSDEALPEKEQISPVSLKKSFLDVCLPSFLYGLGLFGLIGWAVTLPTLFGLMCGMWIDSYYPESQVWMVIWVMIGFFVGCLNAMYWLAVEGIEKARAALH